MLLKELMEINEEAKANLKALILKIDPLSPLGVLSDKRKHDLIFGDEEGDDSFVQNQDVVTIEDIKVVGSKVYVYPHWEEKYDAKKHAALQQELQDAFDEWAPASSE